MTEILPGSVEYWAERAPDAVALQENERSLTYGAWNECADRLAEVLAVRAGVGIGDHVALCMHNRLEWFVTQAATAKLGALLVPISVRLTPAEVHYIAADCRSRVFLFDAEDVDALARVWTDRPPTDKPCAVQLAISVTPTERAEVVSFDEVYAETERVTRTSSRPPRSIVYTSGTTGRPRGVVHARTRVSEGPKKTPEEKRRALEASLTAAKDYVRNLLGAPLNHAAGQASARATHHVGGCVYIMPRFDARAALALIARERITTTFLVPTMLNRIMSLADDVLAAHDVTSIRSITTGAAPCPQALKERVIAYFGAHCLVESYGTTEVGIIARMFPGDHLTKPGACGRVIDGVDVQIRDEHGQALPRGELGEICVRTPYMIERYLNEAPPRELVDGYFCTGDVGRFDADGFLYVLDRKKDMIIAGGTNIYPAEIEDALRAHPAVLDAAVYGVPHPDLGEQVRAAVECIDGRTVSETELLAFVSDRLAAYKRPRAIDFMQEIPRNPAGKVLKRQLREPHWVATGKQI